MKTIISFLLLAVVNLIHCQEHDLMIVFTLQGVLEKLKGISDKLIGFEAVQQKQDEAMDKLMELHHELEHVKGTVVDNQESLQRFEAVQQKQDEVIDKLMGHDELVQRIPDVQQKLGNLETNLQELHHKLEHVEGTVVNNQESLQKLSQETGQCLREDDLERLTNVSSAANQEIRSFVNDEISGIISLAEKDECSEGSHPCGELGKCKNTIFSFTCSCPPGFTWDGLDCADIDECTEGQGICSPNAICKNSIGSYSCSCNKPFKGDGRTSCEFYCRIPAKVITGLGCIKLVKDRLTHQEMEDFCQAEGGRLLQLFDRKGADDIKKALGSYGWIGWIGVYDKKWTSDESLVPKDLWLERHGSDPSKRCGILLWDSSSSSSAKLTQWNCSEKIFGFCQFHHHL